MSFPDERTNSLALHLGGGLTLAPALFAPTIGNRVDPEGNQQRPRIRNAALFRSVEQAGVIHHHVGGSTCD